MAARKPLLLAERRAIAVKMLDPERGRGTPGQLAAQYGLSRQMTYYLAERAETALDAALTPRNGPVAQEAIITVTPGRLRRTVTLAAMVGVSQRDTTLLLAEALDTQRSPGYVAQVVAEAEDLAAARNVELQPPVAGLLAADELFLHNQPILGVVHPASLFVADLRLTSQRDGVTWGCTFLDLPEVAGVISDAGQGLSAGATLAEVRCHGGDWFHPLLGAAYVEAQYERQAYAALAKAYAREEKLAQTSTGKRWDNHWQHYLREEAAAAQAIERYDQWRVLRWQLRALASQFDWATGAVRQPETVQAALLALAEQLTPWAVGTRAREVVSVLRTQTAALTAGLPKLMHALQPLLQAWGEETVRVVCRLLQALHEAAGPAWLPAQRRQLEQTITDSLAWASAQLGPHLPTLQRLLAAILAHWPRTSSAIECLNSLLRPYLNGRKQVDQGFLELFRFYHNTHRFLRGKRAGSTPLELAGGPTISDPLAFLGLGAKS